MNEYNLLPGLSYFFVIILFIIITIQTCLHSSIRIQNPKFSLNTTTLQNLIEFSKDDEADKVDEMHYRSLICWLMYLNSTRLDIFFYSKYTFKVYTLC